MARVFSFLIRYFSNYYTFHRSDLAARAAPLDPRLKTGTRIKIFYTLYFERIYFRYFLVERFIVQFNAAS